MSHKKKVLFFRFSCFLFFCFFLVNAILLGKNSVRWLIWQWGGADEIVIKGTADKINKLKGRGAGYYMVRVSSGDDEYLLKTTYSRDDKIFNCKGEQVAVHYFISGGYEDNIYKMVNYNSNEVCYLGRFDNRVFVGVVNFVFFFIYSALSLFAFRWFIFVPNIK